MFESIKTAYPGWNIRKICEQIVFFVPGLLYSTHTYTLKKMYKMKTKLTSNICDYLMSLQVEVLIALNTKRKNENGKKTTF